LILHPSAIAECATRTLSHITSHHVEVLGKGKRSFIRARCGFQRARLT
jgi:hypothetical protein